VKRDRSDFAERLAEAARLMLELELRCANPAPSIDDRAEHSLLATTSRKLEEVLATAAEYQQLLDQQIGRTSARLASRRRT